MKSKVLIALFFSFWGLTIDLHAQNDKKVEEKTPLLIPNGKRLKQQSLPVQSDKYHNKEQEILARLNVEIIPSDFPVYTTEYTEDQYTALMNKWYNSHTELLKKETNINQPNKQS